MTSGRGITLDGTNPEPPGMYKTLQIMGYFIPYQLQLVSLTGFLVCHPTPMYHQPGTSNRQERQQQQRLQVKEQELQRCYKTLGPEMLCSSAFWGISATENRGVGAQGVLLNCSCVGVATIGNTNKKYYHIQGAPQKPTYK